MVKISYEPWDQIVVHEIIVRDSEELFTSVIMQALASGVQIVPSVAWWDGVAFTFAHFPDTDDIVRDKLKGTIHYSSVSYATYPDYKPEVPVKIGTSSYPIKLQKAGSNPTLVELVKFLKDGFPKRS